MARKPVRTAGFSSGVYRIYADEHIHGLTLWPERRGKDRGPKRYIYVDSHLKGLAELETWIHEAEHAEDRDASEQKVERRAKNIARLLWRLGYRKAEDD